MIVELVETAADEHLVEAVLDNDRCRWRLCKNGAQHMKSGHTAAALAFGVPIISVTIAEDRPHLHRASYQAYDENFGLEAIVTLCLSGPEAEKEFCGPITDHGDYTDYQMAYRYLRCELGPLQISRAFEHYRDAARRLITSPWAQARIRLLADALLRHGTLSGEEIAGLSAL